MKIREQDQYHGAALTQIVEHESFKALNRGSSNYGHYLINTDRHVFVKYRTASRSPWQHTFSEDEVQAIADAIASGKRVWLCLVCGDQTVCALDQAEIEMVIDLTAGRQQWIRVEVPKGGRCWVSGSYGRLAHTVPHNSFPNKLFAS